MIDQQEALSTIVTVELELHRAEARIAELEQRITAFESLATRITAAERSYIDLEFKQRIQDDHLDMVISKIDALDARFRAWGFAGMPDESQG